MKRAGIILKNKSMAGLLLASMVNRLGDSADMIAVSWLMYQITGSASLSALAVGVNFLPTIFLQPLAGAAVERKRKKRIMILTDIGRGLLVAAVLLCMAGKKVSPWMLLITTFSVSVLEAFRSPSLTALLAGILTAARDEEGCDREAYEKNCDTVQSLFHGSMRLMELAGMGIAGVVIAAAGIEAAFCLDLVCFFLSAVLEYGIRERHTICSQKRDFYNDLKEGFRYLKSDRHLLLLLGMCTFLNAVATPINALETPLVAGVYGKGSRTLSLISVVLTLGMAFGAALYQLGANRIKIDTMFMISGILNAVFYWILAGLAHLVGHPRELVLFPLILSVSCFVFGGCIGILNTQLSAMLMKSIPVDYMARISAWINACCTVSVPGTSLLISLLLRWFGVTEILNGFGFFVVLIALAGIYFAGPGKFRLR